MSRAMSIPSWEQLVRERKQTGDAVYGKPVAITSYSYDEHRQWRHDQSQLRQYVPDPNLLRYGDLFHGYETFRARPEILDERLDGLLSALAAISGKLAQAGVSDEAGASSKVCGHKPDLVMWRGLLTKIMTTPAFPADSWCIFGTQRNGTTYLVEDQSARKITTNRRQKLFQYGGYKFESLCMVPKSIIDQGGPIPSAPQRQAEPVSNFSEYGVVFRTRIGGFSLIFGAEIDGIDKKSTANTTTTTITNGDATIEPNPPYVELKTCFALDKPEHVSKFYSQKLPKYWTQSFLAGVPNIIVGYRNHRGWLTSIEQIAVNKIPGMVRGKVEWDPGSILKFGELVFRWLLMDCLSPLRASIDCPVGEIKFRLVYDPNTLHITFEVFDQFEDFLPSPSHLLPWEQ